MNIFNKYILVLIVALLPSCIVVPHIAERQEFQCALSTDKKTLKLINFTDGDATFYAWQDDIFSIITIPSSAIISGVYVAVNNGYHIGEKHIKCN